MPKVFTSKTQSFGKLGEGIACRFLENLGHKIIETNYTKKWGEIDIVSQKGEKVFFVEVKSKNVSDLSKKTPRELSEVSPEENVHPIKIKRLMRTIESYIAEKELDVEWEVVVLAVFVDTIEKTSKIRATKIFE